MMHRVRIGKLIKQLALAMLLALPAYAPQAADPADCGALNDIARNKTYDADDREIYQCLQRGWDPPVGWRPDEGKSAGIRVSGAGGFSVSSRQAPDMPPGKAGANSSVSTNIFNFTAGFPPWRGFPCQLPGGIDICGSSYTPGPVPPGGGSASCAVAADTTGTFGTKQTIRAGTTSLPCGGAVPLSTYLMGMTQSPVGMLATENGNRTTFVYRASGTNYARTSSRALPSYLCNSRGNRTIDLYPPVAQMLTFPASGQIAVRLQKSPENINDITDPFDPDPTVERNGYLLIPIVGGVPQIPRNCARDTTYFSYLPGTSPLTVESATTPGCEGDATQCGSQPTTPTASGACDTVTLQPAGTSCAGTTQFAVLDRPNIVYPPGSSATFATIQGRTALTTRAANNARLYAQGETIMYFGSSGGAFVLPEGGTLLLSNGDRLQIYGPGTVNAAAGVVNMTSGGAIMSIGGTLKQAIPAGTNFAPVATRPYAVRVGRSVQLPDGYTAPTQPSPYIQMPVAATP